MFPLFFILISCFKPVLIFLHHLMQSVFQSENNAKIYNPVAKMAVHTGRVSARYVIIADDGEAVRGRIGILE